MGRVCLCLLCCVFINKLPRKLCELYMLRCLESVGGWYVACDAVCHVALLGLASANVHTRVGVCLFLWRCAEITAERMIICRSLKVYVEVSCANTFHLRLFKQTLFAFWR